MAKKSKFFRVATEGQTTDGRTITRQWIEQMAANYNPQKYGARVNLEHLRSVYPDSVFRMYGDVTAVKAEQVDVDGETKLALFAQIDPTEELIKLNKERQKVYTSIEVHPDFAGQGEAYLMGLAVTDSPASLGTEMLQFCSQAQVNPLAERKQDPATLFTASAETAIEFEEEQPKGPSLFSRVKDLLGKAQEKNKADFSDVSQAVEAIAEQAADNAEQAAQFSGQLGDMAKTIEDLAASQKAAIDNFSELKAQLSQQQLDPNRPPATGGNGFITTDC